MNSCDRTRGVLAWRQVPLDLDEPNERDCERDGHEWEAVDASIGCTQVGSAWSVHESTAHVCIHCDAEREDEGGDYAERYDPRDYEDFDEVAPW